MVVIETRSILKHKRLAALLWRAALLAATVGVVILVGLAAHATAQAQMIHVAAAPPADARVEPAAPAASTGMYISPTLSAVAPGDTFSVTVMISSTDMMRGAQAGLQFNPTLLEATGWQQGTLLKTWAVADGGTTVVSPIPVINNTAGTISIGTVFIQGGAHTNQGPTGAGSLFIYGLRVKPGVSGLATLTLSSTLSAMEVYDVDGYPLPNLVVTGGQVQVGSSTPAPRMYVSSVTSTVNTGESFSVTVMISSATMMRGAQAGLQFDPALLEATGWTEGTLLKTWAVADGGDTVIGNPPVIDNVHGTISLAAVAIQGGAHTNQGPTGAGSLLTYGLRAKPGVSGRSALTLDNRVVISDVNGATLPNLVVSHGQVQMGCGALGSLAPCMYVWPATTTVAIGLPFSVTVMISSATMMRGAQAGLQFNPALLEATGWAEGTLLKTWARADGGDTVIGNPPVIDNVHGSISVAPVFIQGGQHNQQGPTGTGSLLIYGLRAKPGARGPAALTLSDASVPMHIYDTDGYALPGLVLGHGQVQVQQGWSVYLPLISQPPAPTPSPTPTPTPNFPGNLPDIYDNPPGANDTIDTAAMLISNTLTGLTLCNQAACNASVGSADQDYYAVYGAAGYQYSVNAAPENGSPYPYLFMQIIAPDKTTVLGTVDSSNNATINWTASTSGRYYILIHRTTGSPTSGSYKLTITSNVAPTPTPQPTDTPVPGLDAFEPNYDFDHAANIGLNIKYTNINFVPLPGQTDNNDFFKVGVKPGMLVTCETLDLSPGTDTNLIVYDDSRNGLAGNDDVDSASGDLRSKVTVNIGYDGYLYILVGSVFRVPQAQATQYTYSLKCSTTAPASATPTSTRTVTPVGLLATPTGTATPSGTRTVTPTGTPAPGTAAPTGAPPAPTGTPSASAETVCLTCSRMAVSPETITVAAGQPFTVTVIISSVQVIRGARVGLMFDPALIEATGWEEGALFKSWAQANGGQTAVVPQPVIDNKRGSVSFARVDIAGGQQADRGPTGPGSLMIYSLRAKPGASGVSDLTLSGDSGQVSLSLPNGMLASNLVVAHGQVQVGSGAVAATVTPPALTAPPSTLTPPQAVSTDPIALTVELGGKMDVSGTLTTEIKSSLACPCGRFEILIPKGTQVLDAAGKPLERINLRVTNRLARPIASRSWVGPVAIFEPRGASFSPPFIIRWYYDDPTCLRGTKLQDLIVGSLDVVQKRWSELKTVASSQTKSVETQVSHFSLYAVLLPPPPLVHWSVVAPFLAAEILFGAAYVVRRRWSERRVVLGDEILALGRFLLPPAKGPTPADLISGGFLLPPGKKPEPGSPDSSGGPSPKGKEPGPEIFILDGNLSPTMQASSPDTLILDGNLPLTMQEPEIETVVWDEHLAVQEPGIEKTVLDGRLSPMRQESDRATVLDVHLSPSGQAQHSETLVVDGYPAPKREAWDPEMHVLDDLNSWYNLGVTFPGGPSAERESGNGHETGAG